MSLVPVLFEAYERTSGSIQYWSDKIPYSVQGRHLPGLGFPREQYASSVDDGRGEININT